MGNFYPASPPLLPDIQANVSVQSVNVDATTLNNIQSQLQTKIEKEKSSKDTKFRIIQMNDNWRKRKMHYTYILLVWVAAFVIILLLTFICKWLPVWVPCKLVIWILVLAALGVSAYLMNDLQIRDPLDYDRPQLAPPKIETPPIDSSSNDGSNSFRFGLCNNESCCSAGTVWDPTQYVCVADLSYVTPLDHDISATTIQTTSTVSTSSLVSPLSADILASWLRFS